MQLLPTPLPLRFASAILCLAAPLAAQVAQPTYLVQGIVLNSMTHEPIARALAEQGSIAALTDEQGHFELQLPAGSQPLQVHRPGFRRSNQDHVINVGPGMPELVFELTPQITVSGQVELSSGEPADAVEILAYRKSIVDNNREKWISVQNITTRADGAFKIVNLERGGNYVFCSQPTQEDAAAPPPGSKIAPAVRYGYPSACFPGPLPTSTGLASERDSANTLTLTPGQHAEVELSLTREPFYHAIIGVLHSERWPNVDVHIHAISEDHAEFPAEWKPRQGFAETYLPNGQYYAEAFARGDASAYGRVDFRVANKPLSGISLALQPMQPIPVEIHKDFTAAVAQEQRIEGIIRQRISPDDPGVNLVLVPSEADADNGNLGGGELSRPRGASDPSIFQLAGAAPGRYWVEAYPAEGYVTSITSGGVDLTRQPLTIGPGNSTAPILIRLRNDVGRIQATVTSPSPPSQHSALGEMHSYYLYAFPLARVQWQTPQSQGQGPDPITIDGLAPGPYRVVAFDRPQEFNLNDAEAVARLSNLGQSVTVTPGGTTSVQLDLTHATGDEPGSIEVEE